MATEFGPLCTLAQRQKIEQVVASSIQQGAKLLTGGQAIDRAGYYYPPTILDCSDAPQADCVMTELFGPVLSVVSFRTEAQAIQTANHTAYGLAAGIFTHNLSRAHRMTKAIRSGIVWLNTFGQFHHSHLLVVMVYLVMVVKVVLRRYSITPRQKPFGYVLQMNL